jgi:cytochrome b561
MTTTTSSTTSRYSLPSIAMHWLMLLVFIGIYVSVNLIDVFPKEDPKHQLFKIIHFSLGLLVFALVWVRIVFRLMGNTPPIVPAPSALQEKVAKLGHLALYALMIGAPLAGWAALSAYGKPIPFFGLNLPALLSENKELGHNIKEVHEAVGTFGYFLIGGHAAAALYHHYVMKDNTMLRMKRA